MRKVTNINKSLSQSDIISKTETHKPPYRVKNNFINIYSN